MTGAVLHLRRGTYLAEWAEERDGLIRYHGRRRERDLNGDRYYPTRSETVKLRPGEYIEWIDADGAVAA